MQAASFAGDDFPEVLIGLVALLAVLGLWLLVRRRRAVRVTPSPSAVGTVPSGQAHAVGAVPSVSPPAAYSGEEVGTAVEADGIEAENVETEDPEPGHQDENHEDETDEEAPASAPRVLWPFGTQSPPDPVSKPQRYQYDYSKLRQVRKSHAAGCPSSQRPVPLDPFGAHLLAQRPDRPSMDPSPLFRSDRLGSEQDNTVPGSNDLLLRNQLIDLLAQSSTDPIPVTPEVFFTGNADPTSLGLQRGGPSLRDVCTAATKIGNLKGVFEVVVLVEPLSEQELDSSDHWPRAQQIRVLTSLDIEDFLLLVGNLDTIPWSDPAATYADGRPGPAGARAIYFGWR